MLYDIWCIVRDNVTPYSMGQKIPEVFWHSPPSFARLLRVPIYARLYKIFSFSYFQIRRSYVILSATSQRAFRPMVDIF